MHPSRVRRTVGFDIGPNKLVELGPKTDWPAGRLNDENMAVSAVSNVGCRVNKGIEDVLTEGCDCNAALRKLNENKRQRR